MRVVENEGMYLHWLSDIFVFNSYLTLPNNPLWTSDIREVAQFFPARYLCSSFLSQFPNARIVEIVE